jgi:hypothetical protein
VNSNNGRKKCILTAFCTEKVIYDTKIVLTEEKRLTGTGHGSDLQQMEKKRRDSREQLEINQEMLFKIDFRINY